jgi:hypothetical protein
MSYLPVCIPKSLCPKWFPLPTAGTFSGLRTRLRIPSLCEYHYMNSMKPSLSGVCITPLSTEHDGEEPDRHFTNGLMVALRVQGTKTHSEIYDYK